MTESGAEAGWGSENVEGLRDSAQRWERRG